MQKPMKNKIYYSPEAKRDLDDIWEYVESELSNPAAARKVVNSILDDIDRLGLFPSLGANLSVITDTETDYRYIVSGNYMTFYRISQNDIYVDRILYGRRDYLRILFGEMTESEERGK